MERGIRRIQCLILLARRCLLEPVLKAYEGPDKFFLHNVNATDPKISCKLVRSRCARPSSVRSTAHSNGAQVALRAIAPEKWWSQTESNRRHPACKAGALPTELWPRSRERCEAQESCRRCRLEAENPQRTRSPGRPGQTRTADLTLIRRTL